MNEELAAIAGKYDDHVGKVREKYSIAREEAKQVVDEFMKPYRN
ncbi:MAG: hypothetical protein ABI623_11700 [bacterium]